MARFIMTVGRGLLFVYLGSCTSTQGQSRDTLPVSPPPQGSISSSALLVPTDSGNPAELQRSEPNSVRESDIGAHLEGAAVGVEPLPEPVTLDLSVEPVAAPGTRARPEGVVAASVADEALQVWNYGGSSAPEHISNRVGYHPGTRVVVDAKPLFSARFSRTQAATQITRRLVAGLRNRGYWPFRVCFEDGNRAVPKGGGKTVLRLTIGASGAVQRARLLHSTVKASEVSRCIEHAARSLRTDRPLGQRVQAEVTVSTWPGDLPLLQLPPGIRVDGRCSWADAASLLAQNLPEFQTCFASARRKDAGLWGRLELTFRLDTRSRPTGIREAGSRFPNTETVGCVAETLSKMSFPECATETQLSVGFRLGKPQPPIEPSPPAADAAEVPGWSGVDDAEKPESPN